MVLPRAPQDREYNNFVELNGEVYRRVTGQMTSSGLSTAGRISIVTINSTGWTALPAAALANRNAIQIQNFTGEEVKLNYDNTEPGYIGVVLLNNGERAYDITDGITIYAKSSATNGITLIVEELS